MQCEQGKKTFLQRKIQPISRENKSLNRILWNEFIFLWFATTKFLFLHQTSSITWVVAAGSTEGTIGVWCHSGLNRWAGWTLGRDYQILNRGQVFWSSSHGSCVVLSFGGTLLLLKNPLQYFASLSHTSNCGMLLSQIESYRWQAIISAIMIALRFGDFLSNWMCSMWQEETKAALLAWQQC